ncbi:hypothetical protein [Paractinoplanes lichenicola]|uniref:Uncharacterized protein n=1 Tax=Paractinoplanes lichenicola TaxID=2802976 RepID=A0ABS1W5N5_9ACTN|nr:hypothetical protein [Actinoplanes lichenicola]MBL7262046.1 hypothetical protein [Actinoplanes lichenicola]
MEGRRYADEPEPSWYSGPGQYSRSTEAEVSGSIPAANPYDSGIHERPSGAFRLPEQRPVTPSYAAPDPVTSTGSHARPAEPEPRVPVRGPEYPTIQPPVAAAEPTALVPPVVERRQESVYQSKRPVTSVVIAIVTAVLMIPVVRLLIDATFTGDPAAGAIVPAVLLTLGFTLTGIGLFSLTRVGSITRETWLRPPVAYLPAGLILLLAAGLAAA